MAFTAPMPFDIRAVLSDDMFERDFAREYDVRHFDNQHCVPLIRLTDVAEVIVINERSANI